jgi:hypothetical protein
VALRDRAAARFWFESFQNWQEKEQEHEKQRVLAEAQPEAASA